MKENEEYDSRTEVTGLTPNLAAMASLNSNYLYNPSGIPGVANPMFPLALFDLGEKEDQELGR